MQQAIGQRLNIIAWILSGLVMVIAFLAWGQSFSWQFSHLDSFRIFPILGLTAFSLMWGHYIMSAARQYLAVPKQALHRYFEVTSLAVLTAILLHPGLLWWQLWRDGLGLPPGSYLNHYVAPSLRWAAILGTISLFIFLGYEFRRLFSTRSWWHYVEYATDAAIIAIYIHALKLGTQLQSGWFKLVWWFYGLTLLISLIYIYYRRFKDQRPKLPTPT